MNPGSRVNATDDNDVVYRPATLRRRGVRLGSMIAVAVLAVGFGASLVGVAWDHSRTSNSADKGAGTEVEITVSVLGDSNTAAHRRTLAEGLASGSWAAAAISPTYGTTLDGGWAMSGANSSMMLENTQRWRPDVLVIMIGTNDLARQGYELPWAKTRANIIASVAKALPKRVLISAVAPLDVTDATPYPRDPTDELVYNARLRALASYEGWTFVDPWSRFRAPDGTWTDPNDTSDGVHGTRATWSSVGRILGPAIERVAAQEPAVHGAA
jgi:lysophospholipase L1-like esterase